MTTERWRGRWQWQWQDGEDDGETVGEGEGEMVGEDEDARTRMRAQQHNVRYCVLCCHALVLKMGEG